MNIVTLFQFVILIQLYVLGEFLENKQSTDCVLSIVYISYHGYRKYKVYTFLNVNFILSQIEVQYHTNKDVSNNQKLIKHLSIEIKQYKTKRKEEYFNSLYTCSCRKSWQMNSIIKYM